MYISSSGSRSITLHPTLPIVQFLNPVQFEKEWNYLCVHESMDSTLSLEARILHRVSIVIQAGSGGAAPSKLLSQV